jgi:hypothetical protein
MFTNRILLKQLEKFLKEKIAPYFNIISLVDDELDSNKINEHELIKKILISLVTDDFYKDALEDIDELQFYSADGISIDTDRLRKALINRLVSLGLPEYILKYYTVNELLLIYLYYYIFDRHKGTPRYIVEFCKLFNLDIISIAELYINYDHKNNRPYFITQWLYNPFNQPNRILNYDDVYNTTPGFLIDKETIIANKDKIAFPIKSNILYIEASNTRNLSKADYLKAVYVLYLFKDEYIDIELPLSKKSMKNPLSVRLTWVFQTKSGGKLSPTPA